MGSYGTWERRWLMAFSRDERLSSLSMVHHGASGISVYVNISSFAREYSSHLLIDSTSVSESFHRRIGSLILDLNRASCSVSETENQYLTRMMPSSTSSRSKMGVCFRKSSYCSGVQYP